MDLAFTVGLKVFCLVKVMLGQCEISIGPKMVDDRLMAEIRFHCFSCSTELILAHPPGRRDECPKCGADLHVCRNCRHYDANAYNECREPVAEVVREKERANFCDHFVAGSGQSSSLGDRQKDLRAAAEALFKKKN